MVVAVLVLTVRPLLAASATDLIFYQDFDHRGLALCGSGWGSEQALSPENLVPGRFGKAYRFERPRTNFLSPNQSSVEAGVEGFTAGEGVKLSSVREKTTFGKQVLTAEVTNPGVVWTLTPAKVTVESRYRPAKVFLFSAYLRADRPGMKVRLRLADQNESGDWRARIESANKAATDKDPKAKVQPPMDTVTAPGEVMPGTGWQRVAARLEVDARRAEQALVGTLEVVDGAPATVFSDGLQLEQACVYPLSNTDPTFWIPGGAKRGPAWIDLIARETGFSGERGTLGCWVRPLPDQCGGTRMMNAVLAIGTGWFSPLWQIGGHQWYVGEGPTKQERGKLYGGGAEKSLLETGQWDGWHHLVLAWDEKEAVGYLDGKSFGKTPLAPGKPVAGTILRLGGSFLERTPMTGDLDEVFLYSRRLPEDEIPALADAQTALSADLPGVLLRRPTRTTFLRSESEARIPLELVPYGEAPKKVIVTARVPDLKASMTQAVAPGQPATLTLNPWLGEPGKYPLTVQVKAGKSTITVEDFLEIFEEPPTPEFFIYAWGGEDRDLEERGFNRLFGEPRGLLDRGMWATARIDVRDAVPHPWSAETRAKAKAAAERIAREAMAHPNVRACLVNSECRHPPFPTDQKWFTDWMKQETGLDRVPPEVARDPIHIAPRKDYDPPALVSEDYPPYKFLRWWTERGQGYYLLNNQIVRWMRQAGLQTAYYSDQPEVAKQFEAMDLVDYWGYPKSPEGLVARFSHSSCMARLDGKPFQAMPGTVYWDDGNGLRLTDTDGKRKVLCLSPDCLKENLWLSVACPSSGVGLYGLGERHTEIYDKACDAAMTEAYRLISPVGVLVGGLPAEQAKVALLETDGLYFIQPGVGDDWVRHWLTRTVSRTLARARLPYDWIADDHIYAGWLNRYKAVFVPGAWCLPEKTQRALAAYAKAGGKVVTDKVMRADISGAQRLNIETQSYPWKSVEPKLGGWAKSFRDANPMWAQVTPADPVFTYTREAGPARYLFLINDHREPGPQYEKWKVMLNAIGSVPHEPLRDQGLPQDVQVSIPAGFAVYDVLSHRQMSGTSAEGRQSFTVHLEPGGAAVLAAFPRPIGKLRLQIPARIPPGTEATLSVKVLDNAGQPQPGRQLAAITITKPDGQRWHGAQQYRRITNGALSVSLRLPLTAARGTWKVEVMEWISGLRETAEFAVD